tara:strand:- start:314 stop:520 length:207 start_codon:yes stop_codon:yes gene_type:complete
MAVNPNNKRLRRARATANDKITIMVNGQPKIFGIGAKAGKAGAIGQSLLFKLTLIPQVQKGCGCNTFK